MIVGDVEQLLKQYGDNKIGIISFQRSYNTNHPQIILSSKGDMAEAASRLFSVMREMDEMNIETILAELVPNEGIGKAINDRLMRASF